VVLRLAEQADLPMLLAVNDAVTRFLPYATWQDLADGEAWFGRISARQAAGELVQFVIVHKESGQVIGACLLFRFDIPSGRAELGYVLGRLGFVQEGLLRQRWVSKGRGL
jgi:ribosomal-protein-alanine N-acetyltransferase